MFFQCLLNIKKNCINYINSFPFPEIRKVTKNNSEFLEDNDKPDKSIIDIVRTIENMNKINETIEKMNKNYTKYKINPKKEKLNLEYVKEENKIIEFIDLYDNKLKIQNGLNIFFFETLYENIWKILDNDKNFEELEKKVELKKEYNEKVKSKKEYNELLKSKFNSKEYKASVGTLNQLGLGHKGGKGRTSKKDAHLKRRTSKKDVHLKGRTSKKYYK